MILLSHQHRGKEGKKEIERGEGNRDGSWMLIYLPSSKGEKLSQSRAIIMKHTLHCFHDSTNLVPIQDR